MGPWSSSSAEERHEHAGLTRLGWLRPMASFAQQWKLDRRRYGDPSRVVDRTHNGRPWVHPGRHHHRLGRMRVNPSLAMHFSHFTKVRKIGIPCHVIF